MTEGTRPPSGLKHPTQGSVHRNTVTEYVPHDHNHAPYESAKARRAPQTSLAPDGDSVDLGLVTKQQHKMLTDKSRQGKKRVD